MPFPSVNSGFLHHQTRNNTTRDGDSTKQAHCLQELFDNDRIITVDNDSSSSVDSGSEICRFVNRNKYFLKRMTRFKGHKK